jgi:hypothetical protein
MSEPVDPRWAEERIGRGLVAIEWFDDGDGWIGEIRLVQA